MNEPGQSPVEGSRFEKFEYPYDDFPYYKGTPVRISGPQWSFVMLMVVVGFLVIASPIPFFDGTYAQFIPAILFFAIPLAGLTIVARTHWTAIFRSLKVKDFLWMIAFGVLNLVITFGVGLIVKNVLGASSNPAVAGLADRTASELFLFFLKTAPQLFGEELLTILPFLALMFYFSSRTNCSRKKAIVCAWLISAVLFGLAHLRSYNWNILQCVLVIGTARLILTLAYIKTKNIWVSTGAHIINDWTIFTVTILGASLASGQPSG